MNDPAGNDRTLRRPPLHAEHVALSAKPAAFGGWEMPIAYPSGTLAEHRACRSDAAAFDVSHLGTLRVKGPNALAALQAAFTNDLRRIEPGRAQYTHLLDPSDAGVVDDIIVWWRGEHHFDVMPNASNTSRVEAALDELGHQVGIDARDVTSERAVIAVQGPKARVRLASFWPEAAAVGRFRVAEARWNATACVVAGTGYTGEDGVELAVPTAIAGEVWRALLAAGVTPAGLGARDTLRLEAGLPLHGHELGPGITPLQAGLGWVVRWDKGDFRGRPALERERSEGPVRRLVGLLIEGRQPARAGAEILAEPDGIAIGEVTSGNFSPTLERAIALGFVPPHHAEPGTHLTIDVRGRAVAAVVASLPFVPPGRASSGTPATG